MMLLYIYTLNILTSSYSAIPCWI